MQFPLVLLSVVCLAATTYALPPGPSGATPTSIGPQSVTSLIGGASAAATQEASIASEAGKQLLHSQKALVSSLAQAAVSLADQASRVSQASPEATSLALNMLQNQQQFQRMGYELQSTSGARRTLHGSSDLAFVIAGAVALAATAALL